MVSSFRKNYNDSFTPEKYEAMQEWIASQHDHRATFRIAETPVFISDEMLEKIKKACDDVIDVICSPDFKQRSQASLLSEKEVPNEPDRPTFLQMDFGICEDGEGGYIPQLIELQGFPSLYFYQDLAGRAYRKFFSVPEDYSHLFNGLTSETYTQLLRETIVGDTPPSQVALVDIDPVTQNTQLDFWATRDQLGIPILCISDLKLSGREVYYEKDGRKIPIRKIYHRVIFDELWIRKDLKREFYFHEDHDLEYVGHPNWFFRVSKFTLPLVDSPYAPPTSFLNELSAIPDDLSNYVLKPLFSFAGQGVILNPTREELEAIEKPEQFILQKKVQYAPVVQTFDDPAKVEIRMMFIWKKDEPRPLLVNNLVRLSKGEMVGVRYNMDKTWVGGSVGYARMAP